MTGTLITRLTQRSDAGMVRKDVISQSYHLENALRLKYGEAVDDEDNESRAIVEIRVRLLEGR